MEHPPRLTVNYADFLPGLVASGLEGISAVEVGPYFSPARVAEIGRLLPGIPLHFHADRLGVLPGTMGRLKAYLAVTQNEWLSVHLSILNPVYYYMERRFGVRLPVFSRRYWFEVFIQNIQRLRQVQSLPVIVENMPMLPPGRYPFKSEPGNVRMVLERTGCGLLLDLGHARVVASVRGMDVHAYLGQMPLEQVIQIHVSGPRPGQDGWLRDAHQSMQPEDYDLLAWTLERCNPAAVTLEFWQDRDLYLQQVERLKTLLEI